MSFGLKNAPYYFSRLMAELLEGCEKFALPYLDDVLFFSENWDGDISHKDKVLERIQNARLTIKPAKCKFAQDSVKYLGHVVGLGKKFPAQLKVNTIIDFPVKGLKPRNEFRCVERSENQEDPTYVHYDNEFENDHLNISSDSSNQQSPIERIMQKYQFSNAERDFNQDLTHSTSKGLKNEDLPLLEVLYGHIRRLASVNKKYTR
ncbi:retrovirus-related Pol polyprotein from transposon 17.6 [Trichonephila clavata]|uniref:Retrovirus-related Pol polyprotein from transposon 17.6 n=1 Tax=Trichonephila clavata TaxID=2740835 RepID=A0A8X6IE99_TRICU|nr:retrovirus-related Pol polyprotein from transposon 17.6 [Trichonephila clavata]